MVSEENLKCIPVNDLVDLMVTCVNELLELRKMRDREKMISKSNEVQLIQKVIAAKKHEFLTFYQ